MNTKDLERVKQDLDTIEQAAGIGLTYGKEDIWLNIVASACGLLIAVCSLISEGVSVIWSLLPFTLVGIAGLGYFRYKYRRSTGASPVRRREYGLAYNFVPVILVSAYMIWMIYMGMSKYYVMSAGLFAIGMLYITFSLSVRTKMHYLGYGIPIIILSFMIPFFSKSWAIFACGATITISCLAVAAIQYLTLKKTELCHVCH
ncbi:hypothetical protein ACFL02_04870 [Planctomycetota bacterium]